MPDFTIPLMVYKDLDRLLKFLPDDNGAVNINFWKNPVTDVIQYSASIDHMPILYHGYVWDNTLNVSLRFDNYLLVQHGEYPNNYTILEGYLEDLQIYNWKDLYSKSIESFISALRDLANLADMYINNPEQENITALYLPYSPLTGE